MPESCAGLSPTASLDNTNGYSHIHIYTHKDKPHEKVKGRFLPKMATAAAKNTQTALFNYLFINIWWKF